MEVGKRHRTVPLAPSSLRIACRRDAERVRVTLPVSYSERRLRRGRKRLMVAARATGATSEGAARRRDGILRSLLRPWRAPQIALHGLEILSSHGNASATDERGTRPEDETPAGVARIGRDVLERSVTSTPDSRSRRTTPSGTCWAPARTAWRPPYSPPPSAISPCTNDVVDDPTRFVPSGAFTRPRRAQATLAFALVPVCALTSGADYRNRSGGRSEPKTAARRSRSA